jgi:hypothetical protein
LAIMKGAIIVSTAVSSLVSIIGTIVALNVLAPAVVEAQETRIRAESVDVVDGNGTSRILMSAGLGARVSMLLRSQAGINRISISTGGDPAFGGISPDDAYVRVFAPEGPRGAGGLLPIASLGTTQGGAGSTLDLKDRNDQTRIQLLVDADGNPSIEMRDASGNVTWRAQ